ncbi:MAG: CHRD domain-containing protein, partial [Chloroflexi bacterium]|nr:CHRD domain-containing protein [Chloroflexota bacterium]
MKVRVPSTFRVWFIAAVVVGLTALVPGTMSAQMTAVEFEASLSGASEVPANESTATGTFTATLNAAGELEWSLSVPEIEEATAAHLHLGVTGENGPVVVSLFTAPESGPVGSIDVSGTATADVIVGPIEGDFEAFTAAPS